MKEISAGGVVLCKGKVLMLKKFNDTWVLPKGRIEQGERLSETALREVLEESNVKAQIVEYIDSIKYQYFNPAKRRKINKEVHWFLMESNNFNCSPLRDEGFYKARYEDVPKAMAMLCHKNERDILERALKMKEQSEAIKS
ncbi:MAG: NUDIX hydrolase [Tissierellia bacterium]|nr:NUDIX hydrolase [Tissierellia bacterium]